jgi:hypothetical protein
MKPQNWHLLNIAGVLVMAWTVLLPTLQNVTKDLLHSSNETRVAIVASNATYSCVKGIRFDWRVKNISSETVYIYTPFIEGQAAGALEYDRDTGTILIPTSMKGDISFPPYSYPDPTFRALAPQEQITGTFHEPTSTQVSCSSLRPQKLVFEVAWGKDTTQVLAEVSRVKKEGRVHPANPIVHWAKLATSQPVPIRYLQSDKRGR